MQPKTDVVVRATLFYASLAAWAIAIVLALAGQFLWALACVALALGADAAGRIWSRKSPVPMPYSMRGILHLPRGPHSPARLLQVLQPRRGERILEVGPGVGVHALPVASHLIPDGVLDVLDIQQEMLDDLARRAARRGLTNIVPRQGDAQQLPYPPETFDAAYLIGVLGEIPDPLAALRQLRRVLKRSGRLIISELVIDPDFVPLRDLEAKAHKAGLVLERSVGPRFAYSAVFRPMAA